MICENCGAKIRKNARYCPDCGMDVITDHKPLQNKYLRREHLEDEEELLDDDYHLTNETNNRQEYSEGGNNYQNEEYRAYEVTETQGSGWGLIILLLIVALLIGFVMGFIFFSGKLLNIPSVP